MSKRNMQSADNEMPCHNDNDKVSLYEPDLDWADCSNRHTLAH